MRISTLSLRIVTAIVLTTVSRADGAQPTGRTAIIDLGHIFDNSTYVKVETEKIRRAADSEAKKFQAIEAELKAMAEELKKFNRGTPEYSRKEAAFVQKRADAKVQAQLKQKELQDRRSKVYFAAYKQIEELVRLYSQNNGITLVLRTNRAPDKEPQTTAERMRRIQRPVVFEQNVNITRPILEELNRRAAAVSVNGTRPGIVQP